MKKFVYFKDGMLDTLFKYERSTKTLYLQNWENSNKWIAIRENVTLKIIDKEYSLKRLTTGDLMLEML